MILCNLSVLLAERRLRISKVALDTGISRTTLTALSRNSGKGIQFDTANQLCIYLGVDLGQLFTVVPFDFEVTECMFMGLPSQSATKMNVRFSCKYTDRNGSECPFVYAEFVRGDFNFCNGRLIIHSDQSQNSIEENFALNKMLKFSTTECKEIIKSRFLDVFEAMERQNFWKKDDVSEDEEDDDALICNEFPMYEAVLPDHFEDDPHGARPFMPFEVEGI